MTDKMIDNEKGKEKNLRELLEDLVRTEEFIKAYRAHLEFVSSENLHTYRVGLSKLLSNFSSSYFLKIILRELFERPTIDVINYHLQHLKHKREGENMTKDDIDLTLQSLKEENFKLEELMQLKQYENKIK
jgi:hypothetical protein